METRKFADARLSSLECPELAALIRGAPPAAQRHFAFACVRLALSSSVLEGPVVDEAVAAAASVLKDLGGTSAPHVVRAREAAWALMRTLDDRQLTISEQIRAVMGDDTTGSHPRDDEQRAAFRRYCAASALFYLLHEDALESAAQCAYELLAGLDIDLATILAIGRDTLR